MFQKMYKEDLKKKKLHAFLREMKYLWKGNKTIANKI